MFITGHDADDAATQAARLVSQHAENQHRANLSDAEELDVIAGLADLGVSAAQIATRTKVRRGRVDHALAGAGSELARTAAARYELTIPQAAVIAEFTEDTETVTALLAAARTDQFDHVAQLARNNRALTEQAAEITDELRRAGVTVLDTAPRDHRLDSLRTLEGDPLTPENHHDCPGHAAVVETAHGYVDPATRAAPSTTSRFGTTRETHSARTATTPTDQMTNPPTTRTTGRPAHRNGPATPPPCGSAPTPTHTTTAPAGAAARSSSPDPERPTCRHNEAEAARANRRDVITSNKAWHAARRVRRDWLAQLAARKTAPKGTATFLALTLAQHPDVTHGYNGHQLAADLLSGTDRHSATHPAGMSPGRNGRTAALLLAGVSEGRALLVALLVVLAGYEADAPTSPGAPPTTAPPATCSTWPTSDTRCPTSSAAPPARTRCPRHSPTPRPPDQL